MQMNKVFSFCQKALNKFCQQGVSDRATFIKNISVIGFVLSSFAQTTAIIFNNQIPSKEKKFLIPQELLDGLINATLFWFITSKAVDFGKLLILKKKILPQKLVKPLENYTVNGKNIFELKDNFIKHIGNNAPKDVVKLADDAVEGMGVVSGIVGAILTNNIITPILRNRLAGIFQQKEIKKMEENPPLHPYYANLNLEKYKFNKPSFGIHSKINPNGIITNVLKI